ncbi:VanZ family protein [Pseudidiomarina sp.]|uniref:VanZ family protein n=1 Tax=Pseudidiomarina sp. TaxID=2081707 RepID=UPI00299DE209|nr:VanZ family protein [Pseudidiomarina sp.]MDX1705613.1 VanZ family protein [Pseudidiomarina sp.]
MTKKNTARLLFLLVLIGLSAIFLMRFSSGDLPRFEHADKVVHFGAFFILALTFHRAFPIPFWVALIILTAYGLAIEYVQNLLPYRQASMGDLLADAAGAAAYYLLVWWRYQRRKVKARS